MESIFLVLSGVILMAGVLYWFWSHIQLTQKKVQLLENAVFELRGMVQRGGGDRGPGPDQEPVLTGTVAATVPEAIASMYNDLSDDDWKEDVSAAPVHSSTPLESLDSSTTVPADLQPGGRIEGVVAEEEVKASPKDLQFRELFTQAPAPTPLSETTALEGMAVKELRRLAEQRGIPNASELRKKEILSALKSQIVSPALGVEKMLDLTEVSEILE
jgi:hypothetical protein